jgi:hypothetical protein
VHRLFYFFLLVPASSFNWGSAAPAQHPGCQLETSSVAAQINAIRTRSGPGAIQRAVRDFTHRVGSPYVCLYVREAQAHPDQNICWLLVQQSATRFMRYSYRAQRVDSIRLEGAAWPAALARLPTGCYWPICESISTSSIYRALLVKRSRKVQSGMTLEDTIYLGDYEQTDQRRIAPVAAFIRLLDK